MESFKWLAGDCSPANQLISCADYAATPNDHGSACIASGSEEVAVSQLFLLPRNLRVNLLSRTQLFLLCIVRCFCPATFASVVCAFCCPAVFAAPQQFERIIEARLGLSG
jgi:hypothetical protein